MKKKLTVLATLALAACTASPAFAQRAFTLTQDECIRVAQNQDQIIENMKPDIKAMDHRILEHRTAQVLVSTPLPDSTKKNMLMEAVGILVFCSTSYQHMIGSIFVTDYNDKFYSGVVNGEVRTIK